MDSESLELWSDAEDRWEDAVLLLRDHEVLLQLVQRKLALSEKCMDMCQYWAERAKIHQEDSIRFSDMADKLAGNITEEDLIGL